MCVLSLPPASQRQRGCCRPDTCKCMTHGARSRLVSNQKHLCLICLHHNPCLQPACAAGNRHTVRSGTIQSADMACFECPVPAVVFPANDAGLYRSGGTGCKGWEPSPAAASSAASMVGPCSRYTAHRPTRLADSPPLRRLAPAVLPCTPHTGLGFREYGRTLPRRIIYYSYFFLYAV